MKKILRSSLYVVSMLLLALVPDAWLWHLGVGEWPLPLAVLWCVPTALLLLAETGLQLGLFHKTSVRVLFSMLLFSVFPKVVFILFNLVCPWWVALVPALGVMAWFLFGFVEGWKRLEVKNITFRSPDLPLISMATGSCISAISTSAPIPRTRTS